MSRQLTGSAAHCLIAQRIDLGHPHLGIVGRDHHASLIGWPFGYS
jgi:hypothetical protein